jgi:hypothetical protein
VPSQPSLLRLAARRLARLRLAAPFCAAVAAAVLIVPPGTAGATTGATAAVEPALTFLHVVTPTSGADVTPYLADAAGRQVLLHGAAAVGMEDVAYPGANGGPPSSRSRRRPTPADAPRPRR